MSRKLPLWLTIGAAVAAVSFLGGDLAEAKKTRHPRGRRPHRFLTAPAPSKGRTPETDAGGAPAAASRDVAGAALEAPSGQKTLQGGTAIVLSPERALVANPWRGLAVVDTTDPANPKILGSVALEGSADRVFVDGSTALVVSRTYDAAGGGTKVTAVDLSDESHPTVAGVASVAGDLVAVEQSGGDLVVLTSSFSYGPWVMMGGNGGGMMDPAGAPSSGGMVRKTRAARNAADTPIAPDLWYPGGGDDKVRVARVRLGDGGVPTVAGELALDGVLVGHALDGDSAVLVLDRTVWGWPGPVETVNTVGKPSAGMVAGDAPTGGIELTSVDASAAPSLVGKVVLSGISGVSALDVAGGVARVVAWSVDGTPTVATFQLGAGDPAPLGTASLPAWPESSAFSGDRFVWTSTTWDQGVYGGMPGVVSNMMNDVKGDPGRDGTTPTYVGPTTTLHVVDLSDPANPAVGGSLDLGTGYTAGLQSAGADVLATVSEWSEATTTTHVLRVDLADAANPSVAVSADIDGSWYGSITAGDLLLLSGGVTTDDGAWEPRVLPVSFAGTGLVAGAPFDAGSWIAAAAWSAPILAAGSTDAVRFFDLSDLAKPAALGSVRLAVNVADLTVLGDGAAAACLVTDWVGGAIEVRTVSLPGADALAPLDTVTLGTGDARLFRDGSMLYVLSTDWSTGRGGLTVVDATDPADLRVRGSLDLASYPGQAFLVNGSMVLLREAWSLAATDETTGKTKMLADPFGRCRRAWLRDELSAVLDVVDLSDPDAPRAASRHRLRWDFGGEAILRGATLYVPSYVVAGISPEGWERYAYGVRGIDLSNPESPRIGRLVEVPGSLAAAADDAGRVLTVSYDYEDATGGFAATLHLVDLTSADWRARVVADHALAGSPGAVVAGTDYAYVTTEAWDPSTGASTSALDALSLADLTQASTQTRERSAWGGTISGGHLFLRTWGWTGALDAYALDDPSVPAFAASAALDGVGTSVGVAGGRAYVPAGWRGVASFDLKK